MKHFLYNKGTKAAAVALVAVNIAVTAMLLLIFAKTDIDAVYQFEADFAHSITAGDRLTAPLLLLDKTGTYEPVRIPEGVEYLIQTDDAVFSSNPNITSADFSEADLCYLMIDTTEGDQRYLSSSTSLAESLSEWGNEFPKNMTAYVRLEPTAATLLMEQWSQEAEIILVLFVTAGAVLVTAALLLLYLLCVCGRREPHGAVELSPFDRLWTELRLFCLVAGGLLALVGCLFIADSFYRRSPLPDYIAFSLTALIACFGSLICEAMLFSLVRDLKNNTLLSHSIICQLFRHLWHYMRHLAGWTLKQLRRLCHMMKTLVTMKTGIFFAIMLIGYSFLILVSILLLIDGSVLGFFIGLATFVTALVLISARVRDLEAIRCGVAAIKNGQMSYTMPLMRCEDYQHLSDDIETIGVGLSDSVSEKLRAERMKTELITNVSHDLKTPLTSIINYTRLLQQLTLTPQEAVDYVAIIAKKSERLKQLTSDLFDMAKVQSGNETIEAEELDVALLFQQSLAEYEEALTAAGLTVLLTAAPNIHIMADGKKMSRVMGNLLGNVVKYALSGTRVFIGAHVQNGHAVLHVKNTSAYPLDFDTEEITERFVRGSRSRSEEGNGLGLAIAKSYTEACGGRFSVLTDGDLFKIEMEFETI